MGRKKRVLVLGSSGLLGATLCEQLTSSGLEVVTSSRKAGHSVQLDPLNFPMVRNSLQLIAPDVVLNLVGHTSVEECEEMPSLAFAVNVMPLSNLVLAREVSKCRFSIVQISTDHFYHSPGESHETSVEPLNIYAVTKLQAEAVLDLASDVALRTNFVGRSQSAGKESLTDWLISSAQKKAPPARILKDVYFSPLSMATLSKAIAHVVRDIKPGVFNLGSHGGMSKAEFDRAFLSQMGLDHSNFHDVTLDEAHFLRAPRPRDMRMNVALFESTYGLMLPSLEQELTNLVEDYQNHGTH